MTTFTSHLAVRITPQMMERLEQVAAESEIDKAEVVRILIAGCPDKVKREHWLEELEELGAARSSRKLRPR